MSYQGTQWTKKATWRGNIPTSIDSCRRFNKLKDAQEHAKKTSKVEHASRHVIHTGDVYFSSTTAQIFWYERLIISYSCGEIDKNQLTENDINEIYHED